MKNTKPFFSVVIPTFNRPKTLTRAVESILNQTEKSWEIIISDDGIDSDTFNFGTKLGNRYNNIIYFRHKHVGSPISKNLGIKKAKGQFVTFLDDDDEYLPEHLALRKEVLEKNPQVDFFHGGVEIIGSELVPDKYKPGEMINISKVALGGTFVVKKEVFEKIGDFPNEDYGNDAKFFEKACQSNISILKVNFPTYVYHRHEDSITMRYKKIYSNV